MIEKRWLRIIPVALIMYTISYVDRTNISLALDPSLSTMMKDLFMDDKMKGEIAGIFFIGYLLLQMPGGYLASHWSARKTISLLLVFWGVCAVGCGLSSSFRQFEVWRFFLGVAESGVFPATLVLLANWFPSSERARANAYWYLCQPLAVAGSAPITSSLLHSCGWQTMIIVEGALPFLWLPIWWFGVRDHPREAKWISAEERSYIETTLAKEAAQLSLPQKVAFFDRFRNSTTSRVAGVVAGIPIGIFVFSLIVTGVLSLFTLAVPSFINTVGLEGALPVASTGLICLLAGCLVSYLDRACNSRWSDFVTGLVSGSVACYLVTCALLLLAGIPDILGGVIGFTLGYLLTYLDRARRLTVLAMIILYFLHNCAAYGCMTFFTDALKGRGFSSLQYGILFAIPYAITAVIMIVTSWHSDKKQERRLHVAAVYALSGTSLILSVLCRQNFWVSYGFLCLAIPGPFAAMGPFWTIASEIFPRNIMGLVAGIVNSLGNLGGFVGPYMVGSLTKAYNSTAIPFNALGVGMLACAALALLLPKAKLRSSPTPKPGAPSIAEMA